MEGNNNTWQWQKMWLQSTQVALTKQCRLLKYVDNELHVTMILKHWFAQGMLQDHHDVWEWYMISVSWMLVLLSMHFINKPIWSNSFVSFFSLSLSLSLSHSRDDKTSTTKKTEKRRSCNLHLLYCRYFSVDSVKAMTNETIHNLHFQVEYSKVENLADQYSEDL